MKKLLIIGYVWPEPTSSAAGTRMMQLIDFFLTEKYEIHFTTTASRTANTPDLENRGIITKIIELNAPSFDTYIKKLRPGIVLFDRFMVEEQFGWRVDKFCPDSLKLLDTEDLHFLRKARQSAFKNKLKAEEIYVESDLVKREIAAIYRCDMSLIISEVEMNILLEDFNIPKNILLYLPFLLDKISSEEIRDLPPFAARRDFISMGNFLHEPNRNAVQFLKEKIWPLIRKDLPQANLNIYGAYPSNAIFQLNHPESGFLVHGRAQNAEEVIKNSRLLLAPLQFGAGIKGKLIQAMQCGTPNITTTTGAEGIAGKMPWGGIIQQKAEEFARAAVDLYTDEVNWLKAQKNGFEIINTRFDAESIKKEFKSCIEDIQRDLWQHRKANFTGAMLKHHLHRSTYFMSRFIEEKNKNRKS